MSCRRSTFSFLTAIAALGATGCGAIGDASGTKPEGPVASAPATGTAPDWVQDPTLGGRHPIAVCGAGRALLSGEDMMRDMAMDGARRAIARLLQTRMQAVFKDWTREGGTIPSQEDRQRIMTSLYEDACLSVIVHIGNWSSQRGRWMDAASGRLRVWIYLDDAALDLVRRQMKATVREGLENLHFASQGEADQAVADVDRLVDKQFTTAR